MSEPNETKLRAAAQAAYEFLSRCQLISDADYRVVTELSAALSVPSTETSGDQAPTDSEIEKLAAKHLFVLSNHQLEAGDSVEVDGEIPFARDVLALWGGHSDNKAYAYAVELAGTLRRRHWPGAPAWGPLPDTWGVLSQIDNMLTGMVRATPQLVERKAQPVSDNGAVPSKWIDDPHDIEQGKMLNPAWLKLHGLTATQAASQAHGKSEAVAYPNPIALGYGKVEIANGTHEGVPALIFGRNGTGVMGEATEPNREHRAGESLAIITFANAESLGILRRHIDVIAGVLGAQGDSEAVYLVATGETHNGQETYTRHDALPPLCEAERLYTHARPAADAAVMANMVGVRRRSFIKGWDERGIAFGLKGSTESDGVMNRLMAVYYPRAAPSNPSQSTGDSVRVEGGEAVAERTREGSRADWWFADNNLPIGTKLYTRPAASAPVVHPDAARSTIRSVIDRVLWTAGAHPQNKSLLADAVVEALAQQAAPAAGSQS